MLSLSAKHNHHNQHWHSAGTRLVAVGLWQLHQGPYTQHLPNKSSHTAPHCCLPACVPARTRTCASSLPNWGHPASPTLAAGAPVRAAKHEDGAVTSHDPAHVAREPLVHGQPVLLAAGAGDDATGQAGGKVHVGPPHQHSEAAPVDHPGRQPWGWLQQLLGVVVLQGHQDALPGGVIGNLRQQRPAGSRVNNSCCFHTVTPAGRLGEGTIERAAVLEARLHTSSCTGLLQGARPGSTVFNNRCPAPHRPRRGPPSRSPSYRLH